MVFPMEPDSADSEFPSVVDAPPWPLPVDVRSVAFVFVEPPDPVSDDVPDGLSEAAGEAHADPAGIAIAVPMPRATAKAPIRPTYLLYPVAVCVMAVVPSSVLVRKPAGYVSRQSLLTEFRATQIGA